MKLIATLSVIFLIFMPSKGKCQNYEDAIQKMFSVKDDVDFVSRSFNMNLECKYYLSADTLYTYLYKMALKDIDFTKKYISESLFGTIKEIPFWGLSLIPKPKASVYSYNGEIKNQLDLDLPDKAFAEQTFAYLQKAAQGGTANNNNNSKIQTQEGAATIKETLCQTLVNFLKDMKETNLANFIGKQKSSTIYSVTYYSKTPFPQATETLIRKTSYISDYHRIDATYMKDTSMNKSLPPVMIAKYKELVSILEKCLLPIKFEMNVANPASGGIYAMETEFNRLDSKSTNSAISNIQTRSGFIVKVVVFQVGIGKDRFENSLQIHLDQQ